MVREMFIGRVPSHFEVNSVVKAFMVGEMLLWSAWNGVYPIIALFAIQLPGGDITTAASAYSTYLVVRVMFELVSGRLLMKSGELRKFAVTVLGVSIISIAYLGLARSTEIYELYIFYAIAGSGIGLASPAKNSLFSTHLDKDRETLEWGMLDAAVFMSMALSSALGGFVANRYGFSVLFYLAMIINLCGIFPYLLYIRKERQNMWSIFFPPKLSRKRDNLKA